MADSIGLAVAIVLLAPAIFMALIPMLPALAYMFLITLVYAFVGGFSVITGAELAFLFAFVVASFIVDNVAGILGAKYGGAHTKSLLWGIFGSIVGTLVMPPFGSLVGLFVAIFIAEIHYQRKGNHAAKAASGALLGAVAGVVVNVVLAIGFLGTFIFLALR
ncbi:MAG: DUF456 domain-containing protein [bacterium]|nr:DUF456 domain-containing protein [bacterium]